MNFNKRNVVYSDLLFWVKAVFIHLSCQICLMFLTYCTNTFQTDRRHNDSTSCKLTHQLARSSFACIFCITKQCVAHRLYKIMCSWVILVLNCTWQCVYGVCVQATCVIALDKNKRVHAGVLFLYRCWLVPTITRDYCSQSPLERMPIVPCHTEDKSQMLVGSLRRMKQDQRETHLH